MPVSFCTYSLAVLLPTLPMRPPLPALRNMKPMITHKKAMGRTYESRNEMIIPELSGI